MNRFQQIILAVALYGTLAIGMFGVLFPRISFGL